MLFFFIKMSKSKENETASEKIEIGEMIQFYQMLIKLFVLYQFFMYDFFYFFD